MLSLHHTHIFASDVERTISFWREHFGALVLADEEVMGARNVFLRVGEGRLHLYAQSPRQAGQGTVHHLGIETSELADLVARAHGGRLNLPPVDQGFAVELQLNPPRHV